MPNITELEGCCAVAVLSEFKTDYLLNAFPGGKKKGMVASVKQDIIKEIVMWNLESGGDPYTFYIATTHSRDQSYTEQALFELGFRAVKMESIHDGKDSLRFWKRKGTPREAYLKLIKERANEDASW